MSNGKKGHQLYGEELVPFFARVPKSKKKEFYALFKALKEKYRVDKSDKKK